MNNKNGATAVVFAELLTLIAENDWRITSEFDTPYGYNLGSMNVWVALDGYITICKKIPVRGDYRDNFPVQYMVTDMETNKETFYNTFEEANNHKEEEEEDEEDNDNGRACERCLTTYCLSDNHYPHRLLWESNKTDKEICRCCVAIEDEEEAECDCGHKYDCGCKKKICERCRDIIAEENIEKEDWKDLDCDDEDCKLYYTNRNDNCNCGSRDCGYCEARYTN